MRSQRFQELVQRDPDNVLFRFSLGQALVDEGRAGEAIPHLQRCADARADWMMARILLGRAMLSVGRTQEARPVLEQALRLAVEQNHETPERELRAQLVDLDGSR